jgi:hypothetical protein
MLKSSIGNEGVKLVILDLIAVQYTPPIPVNGTFLLFDFNVFLKILFPKKTIF